MVILPPIFIVVAEPYHENGEVMGAFATIEEARERAMTVLSKYFDASIYCCADGHAEQVEYINGE